MLDIWSEKTGYTLGQFEEKETVNIPLPINPNISGVKYQIISGQVPPGLRLKDSSIIGTPLEVARSTEFKFCVRASKNNQIADRTFKIIINGSDVPIVLTPEGQLAIGPQKTYFVLDSTPVDFQLEVIDYDTAAGQKLRYFISSRDGELPPGVKLTDDGRIVGFLNPLIATDFNKKNGNYDKQRYDDVAFDYGSRSDNGFDSFNFDMSSYDYNWPSRGLKKLNRNYEFIVTITDGDSYIKRKFRIYVVGEDYLRADNTVMKVGNNTYLASNSSLKSPIWRTPTNLGTIRANNYHILRLDIYETLDEGEVSYYLNLENPDSTPSELPPGMKLDIKNGEIFGLIPYQSDISKTYQFTVTVTRFGQDNEIAPIPRTFTINVLGDVNSTMNWITDQNLGSIDANFISNLKIEATSSLSNPVIIYKVLDGALPPGLELDQNGEIIGKVRQYSQGNEPGLTTFSDGDVSNQSFDSNETTFDKRYKFIIRAYDQVNYSAIDREFILDVNTPNDRLYSNIYVTTYMEMDKRKLFYDLVNNESVFPQDKIYRISDPNFGIRKDLKVLIYAGIETITAAEYISAIGLNHKRKRLRFGDIKIAKANTPGTNNTVYEIIYVEMLDNLDTKDQHLPLRISKLPKANRVISADVSNYTWNTEDQDLFITKREPFFNRPFENITIDRTNLLASDPQTTHRFPSTVYNWRRRIRNFVRLSGNKVLSESNYLPLWMRSFQDDKEFLGFTLALPLCYCKPGMSYDVYLNIKNYLSSFSFDFKTLDYTVDRYIIDSVTGYGDDKYLVFKDHEATL